MRVGKTELTFVTTRNHTGPFSKEVIETLNIRNSHYEPVAFKVKTTAPKLYCVRPNSGRIEPGQQVQVQVILQSMKEDPPLDFKCRDKFLVQSVAITADRETQNLADIWNQVGKDALQEKKIRVFFLPPEESSNGPDSEKDDTKPPSYVESYQSAPGIGLAAREPKVDTYQPSLQHGHAANTVSLADFTAQQQALDEARATIELLKKRLYEQEGLRLRNVGGDSKEKMSAGATPVAMAPAPEGVPVKIVAALCLVSFLLALLF